MSNTLLPFGFDATTNTTNAMTEPLAGARVELTEEDNGWEGIVLPFGVDASDGRAFDPDTLAWRDLPLVLYFQEKDEGLHTSPHNNVRPVGRILQMEARHEGLWAAGDFYDLNQITGAHADAVRMAKAMVKGGTGMVSVDALAAQEMRNGHPYYTDSEVIAVTMTGKQAFAGARVRAAAGLTAGLHVLTPVEAGALADVCCGCLEQEGAGICSVPVSFTVVGDMSLPIAERGSGPDTGWDSGEAKDKIFEWAGRGKETGIDVGKLSKAFLYRDPDREPEHEWSWKLPIAIPVGGTLTIIPSAVFAASTVINGGRAPVDIPASEKPRILAKVNRLYDRMGVTRWRDRKDVREREAGVASPELTVRAYGRQTLMAGDQVAVLVREDGEYAVQASCAPPEQLGKDEPLMQIEAQTGVALCPKCSDEIDHAMTEKIAMAVTEYDEKFTNSETKEQ
jgi:hypothetical protein